MITTSDLVKIQDGSTVRFSGPNILVIPLLEASGNLFIEVQVRNPATSQQDGGTVARVTETDLDEYEATIGQILTKLQLAVELWYIAQLEALNPTATFAQT
jgi:hypothetical protein